MEEASSHARAEVWPDNLRAVNLFIAINTQWRMGPVGPVGLDYGVLFHKLDRMSLSPSEYAELEEDIRTMEAAVLDHLHKKK